MKLVWILFALLLAMSISVLAVWSVKEIPDGHGYTHPEIESMQRGGTGFEAQPGGSGTERHSRILWLGWAFGMAQIGFFVACIALGARRGGKNALLVPMLVGLVLYGLTFTIMVYLYQGYMSESEHRLVFFGFPASTAVMLFALWIVPLFFLVLYVVEFNRHIFTPEDLEKFQQIVAARRAREKDAG